MGAGSYDLGALCDACFQTAINRPPTGMAPTICDNCPARSGLPRWDEPGYQGGYRHLPFTTEGERKECGACPLSRERGLAVCYRCGASVKPGGEGQ